MKKQTLDRFLSKIKIIDEHHIWQGASITGNNNNKYGKFCVHGKPVAAHRWAKEYFTEEPIIKGQTVRKMCGVELCVNPDHHVVV